MLIKPDRRKRWPIITSALIGASAGLTCGLLWGWYWGIIK